MQISSAHGGAAASEKSTVALSPEDAAHAIPRQSLSDAQLADCVRRMTELDQSALAQLYDATSNRVYSVALHFVHDTHVAEEVVSDVYYQAWKEADRYNSHRGSVRTWLLVCCRSRAMDALRRRESPHSPVDPDELEDANGFDATPGMDVMESMERENAIRQALERIEPLERQLISLSFFRGYSHAEIALRERMPLGSVKTHIRTALRRLRSVLSEFHE